MKRKILIVDDNLLNRQLLCKLLSDEYDTEEAADGIEALEMLSESYKDISAVLLDIIMPKLNGYETLTRIRADEHTAMTPVIFVTGNTDADGEVKGLALGANDYVTKPYNASVIKHRLRSAIDMREAAAAVLSSKRDELTGLYNRNGFFETCAEMISAHEAGYYVITCFDIDNFKVINDQYGSSKGDEVLKMIARLFRDTFSAAGGICCRIMADTFAVLYPQGFMNSEKLDELRQKAAALDGSMLPITFSIGRYIIDDLSLSVSAMYDRASMAEASVKGRFDECIAVYDESMREHILHEQEITSEMNIALENNDFEVWFQPQYNHSTGSRIGAEALVRWAHPKKGLIPPDEFIPVFERNGFVYELDKFVWKKTCALLRKWIDEGRNPLAVSVNISRYDIFRDDLTDVLTGYLREYDIPVELLRLEITESAFSKSTKHIISVVKKLVSAGFTIEIDDFGSGYSSLNTLKDVPADVLKLDMRFIENDGNSQRGGNILQSIVRMAKWLGMSVIAEGVETRQQADYLRSIGCNYVQGYYYAKPMPAEQYESMAMSNNIGKEEHLLALETVETLDNNAFWDPNSMDTLIFNSFVGGACIFEYSSGKIELLRATEKYAQVMGSAGMTVEQALKLEWADYLDDENALCVKNAIERSISTNDEVTEEFIFSNLPGCPPKTHLRSTLRVIAKSENRYLIYCTNENITKQRAAEEEKRKAELESRKASERLQAIMDNAGSGITAVVLKEDGQVQYLFANDGYYSLLGYTKEQFLKEAKDTMALIHPEDCEWVFKAAEELNATGKTTALEYRVLRRDGSTIWVRNVISIANFDGIEYPVQMGIYTDITAEKEAAEKISETDEQLRFLNNTARDLLAQNDPNNAVESVLKKTLDYFGGERVFIYEYNYAEDVCMNSHEVCAEGLTPYREKYLNFPLETAWYWLETFKTSDFFHLNDINELGGDRSGELEIYKAIGVKTVLAVALRSEGAVAGTMAVFNPTRNLSDYHNLAALGDYMAVILTRRNLNAKIESDRANLLSLMNDMPGGFARMRIEKDGNLKTEFVNEGLCKLRGMSAEEIISAEQTDYTAFVHPEDKELIKNSLRRIIQTGESHSIYYRLRNKDGEYLWFMVFGRLTKNEFGDTFINVYYADMSKKEQSDLSFREMLPVALAAMLRSSSDLSFVKDRNFTYMCASRAFANMAGYKDESEIIGKTDYDLFDKELAERYRADDIKLMQSGESLVDYIEYLPDEEGIVRYSNTSKYLLHDSNGNIIGLYGTGRDVTENREAYSQLKLLTDSIPGGIATYAFSENSTRLIYFNDGLCRLLGYSREEYEQITKVSAMSRVYKEDADEIVDRIREMLRTDEPMECRYRVRTKDGETKWINHKGVPTERHGDTVFVHTLLLDITSSVLAEEALDKSRKDMRLTNQLVDDSSSAVYVCDAKTYELLYVNRNCADMCGKTVEQAKGMTCYAYLKGRKAPCEPCYMQTSTHEAYTEREYSSEVSGKHYMTRGRFINWDGRDALVEYLTDETERINAHKELYRLIAGIPSGVGIYNYYPDGRVELSYMNEGYYTMLGVSREERQAYSGFDVTGALHPDDKEWLMKALAETVKKNEVGNFDIRVTDKGGGYRWVNIKSRIAYKNGDVSVIYASYSDIDSEKKIRLSLEASHRAMEIASKNTGVSFWHYDIDQRTLRWGDYKGMSRMGYPEAIENMPYSMIDDGDVYPDDEDEYIRMYRELYEGAENCECTVRIRNHVNGKFAWLHIVYTRLHDSEYATRQAIGFSADIDLQQQIKQRYEHEIQLRNELMRDCFIYYEVNLTQGVIEEYRSQIDDVKNMHKDAVTSEKLREEILENVIPEDREKVRNTIFAKPMLAAYNAGKSSLELTYRRKLGEDGIHYVKVNVAIMKRPSSEEIMAFLYFNDVDRETKDQLALNSIIAEDVEYIAILNVKSGQTRLIKASANEYGVQKDQVFDYSAHVNKLLDKYIAEEDRKKCEEFLSLKRLEKALNVNSSEAITYRTRKYAHKRMLAFYLDATHGDIIFSSRDITGQYNAEIKNENVRKNEELLRLVVEHSARAIYRYDVETREAVSVEPKVCRAMGLPTFVKDMPESLIADGIIDAEDTDYVRKLFAEARKQKTNSSMRFRVHSSKGAMRWLDVKYTFINEGKEPTAAVISCVDVTDQHEREVAYARYRQSTEVERLGEVIFFETDITADVVEKQGGELLPENISAVGMSHGKLLKALLDNYLSDTDRESAAKLISREHLLTLCSDGQNELIREWQAVFPDNTLRWIRCSFQMVSDPFTGHIKMFTLIKDISEEKQTNLDIQRRAEHDGMTGLLNRITGENAVKSILEKSGSESCVLLIVDIDDLKGINDGFGHAQGDEAIKFAANAIRSSFRKDDIVSRFGGDEFMVFLRNVPNEAQIRNTVSEMIRRVAKGYVGDKKQRRLQCSVGGVFGSAKSESFEQLFKKADTALYHVKRNGKNNYVFFEPEMQLNNYKYAAHRATTLKNIEMFDKVELNNLLGAVSSMFPLIVSVNLTRNSFYIMEHREDFLPAIAESGDFSRAINIVSESIKKDEREAFIGAFSREALLKAYEKGNFSFTVPCNFIKGGSVFKAEAGAVLFGEDNGDVCAFLTARPV